MCEVVKAVNPTKPIQSMNAIAVTVMTMMLILAEEKTEKGIDYFKTYQGVYTLDPDKTFIESLTRGDFLNITLCSGENCVQYYESMEHRKEISQVVNFEVTVEPIQFNGKPPVFTRVVIKGLGSRYTRVDYFNSKGESVFPFSP